jgi:hypothetical protein
MKPASADGNAMERLDPRAEKRISGPAWLGLRAQFEQISEALLSVTPSDRGELTTIYVKFVADEIGNQPYGVVWLKKSSDLVIGLALPEGYKSTALGPPPPGCKYAGLTSFLRITPKDTVPPQIAQWALDAYEHGRSTMR